MLLEQLGTSGIHLMTVVLSEIGAYAGVIAFARLAGEPFDDELLQGVQGVEAGEIQTAAGSRRQQSLISSAGGPLLLRTATATFRISRSALLQQVQQRAEHGQRAVDRHERRVPPQRNHEEHDAAHELGRAGEPTLTALRRPARARLAAAA
ncbi:MAG: hypothetical protein WD794_09005 [Mycobacteriales bacterium]